MPIEKIWLDPKSRDDIPAVLKGLQHIWSEGALREQLLALLDEHVQPEVDRTVGRPGMSLWQILVFGVLKQGLGCDFDRLQDLANHHAKVRAFLGHSDFGDEMRISVKWNTHSGMWNTNSGEVERSSERSDVERSVPPSRFATGT